MTRRRTLLSLLLLTSLGVAAFVWFTMPRHRINAESYAKLKLGMTRREVEDIFQVPPGDYGPGKGKILMPLAFTMTSHSIRTDPKVEKWMAGSVVYYLVFGDDETVWGLSSDAVYRPYDSTWAMILGKVGLKERKPPPGPWIY